MKKNFENFSENPKKHFLPKKRGSQGGGNVPFFPVKSDTTFHWVLTCIIFNKIFCFEVSRSLNKIKSNYYSFYKIPKVFPIFFHSTETKKNYFFKTINDFPGKIPKSSNFTIPTKNSEKWKPLEVLQKCNNILQKFQLEREKLEIPETWENLSLCTLNPLKYENYIFREKEFSR